MGLGWQRRRVRLNHDWLKNNYLLLLRAWIRVLRNEVRDPRLEARFVDQVFPQWLEHKEEVYSLINDMEREMSPGALFSGLPLANLLPENGNWLRELVQDLWRTRERMWGWHDETRELVRKVDLAFDRLQEVIGPEASTGDLRNFVEEFETFEAACRQLSIKFGKVPSRITVATDRGVVT